MEWLKQEFGIGAKDYCVYWFRKAHERLAWSGGAGLVATNSIRQRLNREPSLDHIVNNGGVIVSAVSTQDWPGEAAVDVSIINWVKNPHGRDSKLWLDGQRVAGISTTLGSPESDITGAAVLPKNRGRAFRGVEPSGEGFVLDDATAERLLLEPRYAAVIRPYLTGADLQTEPRQRPRRWIIDFNTWPLEAAMEYLFCWVDARALPSNLVNAFAFQDDWAFGVLSSRVHRAWANQQSGRLEDRLRYNPSTAFETFPFPSDNHREVSDLAVQLHSRRSEICAEQNIGLTRLYNQVDDGAWTDLRDLQQELDEAVAIAYGWPKSIVHDPNETNRRLLELNHEIAAGERPYTPFE